MSSRTPAGWYAPDPNRPDQLRYWDGTEWTGHWAPGSALPASGTNNDGGLPGWLVSWPAIVLGFLACLIPGFVLLWLRPNTSVKAKGITSAVVAGLVLMGAVGEPPATDDVEATAGSQTPTESAPPMKAGLASAPSDDRMKSADELGSWISNLPYGADFDFDESSLSSITYGDIESTVDYDQERVADRASTYPVSDSKVPSLLTRASRARSDAITHYSNRSYASGEESAKRAAELLKKARKALAADIDQVEAACDCRIDGDGDVVTAWSSDDWAEIQHWVDGDTVQTDEGIVRLIGIDTPEMEDRCSKADDAKANAEALAPPGTRVNLVAPYSVEDRDRYGRLLRYVDVLDDDNNAVLDVGYSQILSSLAVARYDSHDGYPWHPREGAYRAASDSEVEEGLLACLAPAAAWYASDEDDEDDDDHLLRHAVAAAMFKAEISDARKSRKVANKVWSDHDEFERSLRSSSGGSSGGGGGGGDYRYCRGWFCIG